MKVIEVKRISMLVYFGKMWKDRNNILIKFDQLTKNPEVYINSQVSVSSTLRKFVKEFYDFTKTEELVSTPNFKVLPELLIDNFDDEQIWQQIELQNENTYKNCIRNVPTVVSGKNSLTFPIRLESVDFTNTKDEQSSKLTDSDISDNGSYISDGMGDDELTLSEIRENKASSEVDDKFFKLSEMEEFLDAQERSTIDEPQSDDSEDSISYFKEFPSDEDIGRKEKYGDFFDPVGERRRIRGKELDKNLDGKSKCSKKKKSVSFKDISDTDSEDSAKEQVLSSDKKSNFELRQERLQQKIQKLEEKSISEKPWQLKGEVAAASRPQNSLLEEIIDFDVSIKPAPIITKETTQRLEDIISQRIQEKCWDDVKKKLKPLDSVNEYKKNIILDHSKSKLSLAQVYEQEYIKQQNEIVDPREKDEEELPEEREIKSKMMSLFAKLDALSNFHYTCKPAMPSIKIVSNLPSIAIEEVAPVFESDARLLAPEEIREKSNGTVISKSERSTTNIKRDNRKRKKHQRTKKKIEEERQKSHHSEGKKSIVGFNEKNKKLSAAKDMDMKKIKSSSTFFTHLQDSVINSSINNNNRTGKKLKIKQNFSSAKLKL